MVQQPAEEPAPQGRQVRIDWRVADVHSASFANQFLVQIARDEFILTFGQFVPPALVQPTPEEIESLPEELSPQIVARVAVTPNGVRRFIQLLQRQLRLYDSGVQGFSDDPDEKSVGGEEVTL